MRELARNRHTPVIEIRFQFPDPRRHLAAVRLAHELRDRLPHELTPRGTAWELSAPAPDVARFEHDFLDFKLQPFNHADWILQSVQFSMDDMHLHFQTGAEQPDWITDVILSIDEKVLPDRMNYMILCR